MEVGGLKTRYSDGLLYLKPCCHHSGEWHSWVTKQQSESNCVVVALNWRVPTSAIAVGALTSRRARIS